MLYYLFVEFGKIVLGFLESVLRLSVWILQLDAEHGSLELFHSRIESLIIVFVFAHPAIVAEGSDDLCQLPVVGGDGSCIAQCAQVLARIEAVSGCITDIARMNAFPVYFVFLCQHLAGKSLRIVFKQQ